MLGECAKTVPTIAWGNVDLGDNYKISRVFIYSGNKGELWNLSSKNTLHVITNVKPILILSHLSIKWHN